MKTLSIRLPDDLHAQLTKAAEMEYRSINEEIAFAISRYLAALAAHGLLDLSKPGTSAAP